mmetsp:Transcript_2294/g.7189  ORF Transcript_2294/g.7189 Transcript_2294/m.7189 type:complete len:130 (+) Transcript_2294:19-408(+)
MSGDAMAPISSRSPRRKTPGSLCGQNPTSPPAKAARSGRAGRRPRTRPCIIIIVMFIIRYPDEAAAILTPVFVPHLQALPPGILDTPMWAANTEETSRDLHILSIFYLRSQAALHSIGRRYRYGWHCVS